MKLKELPISIFHSLRLRAGKSVYKKNSQAPIIVSLTSIPERLASLDIVIKSLLEQSTPPYLIILWLNKSLQETLSKRLIKLQSDVFKIKYCEGTSSYRKLLPTLKAYPNELIVTCDDDMIYPQNWLAHLYENHLNYPEFVISQVGRLISRDKNKQLQAYKKWEFIRYQHSSDELLPIGFGGILYPKGTFSTEIFREDLYMELSPKADDLWFKAMSFLNNHPCYCAAEKAKPIPILFTQSFSLGQTNIAQDANKRQWQSLCKYFHELKHLG